MKQFGEKQVPFFLSFCCFCTYSSFSFLFTNKLTHKKTGEDMYITSVQTGYSRLFKITVNNKKIEPWGPQENIQELGLTEVEGVEGVVAMGSSMYKPADVYYLDGLVFKFVDFLFYSLTPLFTLYYIIYLSQSQPQCLHPNHFF